jgi:uncharacterized membrane protein
MLNYRITPIMKKVILPFIALLIFTITAEKTSAQQPKQAQPTQAGQIQQVPKVDQTLYGQYQQLLTTSKNYYGSKVITPQKLAGFWKNVNDTLRTERRQLAATRKEINTQQKTIAELKGQLTGKENALNSSNQRLDEITFLGISFTKSSYNTMVWTIIIILAIALAIIVIRSAKLLHEAKYRSSLYEEISAEYQSYKVKSNDKEKKLARELQDERNKLDEYKGRGS